MKIKESSKHDDLHFIHENLYSFNLSKTGEARQPIETPESSPWNAFLVWNDEETERLGGMVWQIKDDGKTFFVEFLWLSDRLRGQGFGQKLIAHARERAASLGCCRLTLTTNTFQAPDFYRKLGFIEKEAVPSPVKNCPENIHYTFSTAL